MARRPRSYPPTVRHAAELLGLQVRQARVARRWSLTALAERAGITTNTLRKVERGDPSVTLGVAFDVATLVGVPLFFDDRARLASEVARNRERVTLLPQAVRTREEDVDDEF